MRNSLFLGIDAGTTNVKATVMRANFSVVAKAEAPVVIRGVSEMRMSELWDTLARTIFVLMGRLSDVEKRALAGVGVAAQGDGLWLLDENFQPLENAILWNDARSDESQAFNEKLRELRFRESVNPFFAGNAPMLLRWMRKRETEKYQRARHIVHCKDFLNYKLTGVLNTDHTIASTAMYNLRKERYSEECLRALGLEDCLEKLPEIVEPGKIIGAVTHEACQRTGIPQGTPVVCGMLDGIASILGVGLRFGGQACVIGGTTLANTLLTEDREQLSDRRFHAHRFPEPGKYVYSVSAMNGGLAVEYARGLFAPGANYAETERLLLSVPAGCEGLLFHPYLCGERAPFCAPEATAGFFGMRPVHTRSHMLRAVYEGAALSSMDCYDAIQLPIKEIFLCGGLSRSPVFCRMLADALGKPLKKVEEGQLGSAGIAKLLQVSLGMREGFGSFAPPETVEYFPEERNHTRYLRQFALFRELREMMEPLWTKQRRLWEASE